MIDRSFLLVGLTGLVEVGRESKITVSQSQTWPVPTWVTAAESHSVCIIISTLACPPRCRLSLSYVTSRCIVSDLGHWVGAPGARDESQRARCVPLLQPQIETRDEVDGGDVSSKFQGWPGRGPTAAVLPKRPSS